MLSVDEALGVILDGAAPLPAEAAPLFACGGRIVAEDVRARITQPPFAASAMDGYAVRFADMAPGVRLDLVGEAAAGAPLDRPVGPGEAARIFTGAVVPHGADHILIQEEAEAGDAKAGKGVVTVTAAQAAPRHIRPAGGDFREGDVLAKDGTRLHELHAALFAAANIARVSVRRRPEIAFFSNGDELVDPGSELKPGQIVDANRFALAGLIASWGAVSRDLGRAPDDEAAIRAFFERARTADMVLPIGGASVGDHDYVKSAFRAAGGEIAFEKVAVRPGKPTWFGRLGEARVVGLPGNPASAIVTASLFAQPLARTLAGQTWAQPFTRARLAAPLPANGPRESYLRADIDLHGGAGAVTPAPNQDSALLSPFASANALIRRRPGASPAAAGEEVEIVWMRGA